jgi:hypothetical protein
MTMQRKWRRLSENQGTRHLDKAGIGDRETEEQAEAEVNERADIDSVDSVICTCGSPMPMTFIYANVRRLKVFKQ